MKRSYVSLMVFTALFTVYSCSNSGEVLFGPKAEINLISEVSEVSVLDSVSFTIQGRSKKGITEAKAIININGQQVSTLFEMGLDSSSIKITEDITFIVDPSYAGQNLFLSFTVTDLIGDVDSDTVAFSIVESEIDLYGAKTMGGYGSLTYGSFYDMVTDSVFFDGNLSTTQKRRSIDLVFFHTKDEGFVLASPSSDITEQAWSDYSGSNWPLFGVENATKLYDFGTSVNFDNTITAIQIDNLIPDTGLSDSLDNVSLSVGQVLGYQLSSSRGPYKGLIRVNSLSGSGAEAVITFDAKSPQIQ